MAKILVYALNYSPEPFGAGRYTGEIGDHLAAAGHEVRVVTAVPHYPAWRVAAPFRSGRYRVEQRGGTLILRCPIFIKHPVRGVRRLFAPLSFALTSLPILIWAMLRWRPDVVFCVEPTLFAAPAALALSRLIGARTILHVQDFEVEAAFAVGHLKGDRVRRAALAGEKVLLGRFDQVITISERMREALARKGVARDRTALVRNWVDLDAIRPLEGRSRYRDELGWSDDLCIALYAGSIGAKQALHIIAEAADHLCDRSDILFVIAGDGPAKAQLVARFGHLPNLRFLPPQPEERLCDLLNVADIHLLPQARHVADLVLPSKLGGLLASGKPVLATAEPGTELFEVLSGTAILVPPGDSAAVAGELAAFASRNRQHPGLGDGRQLAFTMARPGCLQSIATRIAATLESTGA